jgi:hypothetical protein
MIIIIIDCIVFIILFIYIYYMKKKRENIAEIYNILPINYNKKCKIYLKKDYRIYNNEIKRIN